LVCAHTAARYELRPRTDTALSHSGLTARPQPAGLRLCGLRSHCCAIWASPQSPRFAAQMLVLQTSRCTQRLGFVGALASAGPCGPSHRLRRYEPAPKASQVRCAQGLTGPLPRAAWQPCLLVCAHTAARY